MAEDTQSSDSPDADLESSRMPFLDHLRELRDRVRNAAIFFALAFGLCWYFSREIFKWLQQPALSVWDVKKLGPFHLTYTELTEPFWVDMSIALWAGIFVASPFIFHQLWKFIAPGLYKRERKMTVAFSGFSALFFVSGALFCYHFVLTKLYKFLLGYGSKDLEPDIKIQAYLDLTRDMMLAFGAVFELPLLIFFLAKVGLVTHRSLWKFNRWFVVIAFIIGAILTPSPDVVSQLMMALPMIALYNISILIAWYVTRSRERQDAGLQAPDASSDRQD
ncbi:MAG: twin-arginine translocase subunit TatC [Kofleriaceae bacterium]